MYNDCIMAFYLTLSIFFFSRRKIYISATFLTLSLGIKTGVYAVFPAFLGCVQMQHGSINLILVILIILVFQVISALPIVYRPVGQFFGFTNYYTPYRWYLFQSQLYPGTQMSGITKRRGANFEWSVYWVFLNEKLYNEFVTINNYKRVFMLYNFCYFFIRRNCFPLCYKNLKMSILEQKVNFKCTQRLMNKCLEIILIQYVVSCAILPGGHENFQIWYINFVPMTIFFAG